MPKNSIKDINALVEYGGKVTTIDEKNRVFGITIPVGEKGSIELNMHDANLRFALEAIARSAYEKGRWDQKQESRIKVLDFLKDLTDE